MSWFDTSGLTNLAKTALKEAQKTIDKALDIQDESGEEQDDDSPSQEQPKAPQSQTTTPQKDDFFASWGLTVSAESDTATPTPVVVTESPSKSSNNNQSMWGSFAGSFFEHPKTDSAIVKPPKAKSMDVIADTQFGSHDDLFSRSQLVMSDSEGLDNKVAKKDDVAQEERRDSSRSNILSLMSSRHSSDSVEVLSQSLKTTPDSEASIHSISQCSSGQKHNSESVEILPDSLVSPSSIECLGFDSYTSDKTSSTSSMLSPEDISDKKSTPFGDCTEKAETADSVSLVADDDDDTMSYNSVSECTAPTVLDTDDKVSTFPKSIKNEQRKDLERELMNLEQAIIPQKLINENSSNDGSSDRTLNADNDSLNLENTVEDKKEQEDILMEKLSDSSSFYNVNVSSEMVLSQSSTFVEVDNKHCSSHSSSAASNKDGSTKERTSPVSSDSKSDMVKVGSDRTSGHTSGDEVETATSSDIEIIPSPNGEGFSRNSPAKYSFNKNGKFDGATSPNLVDLVLGKSLATKIRGHTRELSETSIQSNTSDESQGSENERLMRRLCEMAEILDARENRLMEVSRSNAELAEHNAELKTQVDSLMVKHEVGDINMITEDYTQRMSALEKKFQQAIREKDNLRKQLDTLKSKNSMDHENTLKEKDEIISQLHEEGEKLAKQQLQHSNIIKKLRAKEKDNEQLIKNLRDKIAEQTAELERVKRSMAAKEELEVNQIEAVYRLTTTNKKLEAELNETRSALDDATQRLDSSRLSLEAARSELVELQRGSGELARLRALRPALDERARHAGREADQLRAELNQLRSDIVNEERRWVSREEALRRELVSAREACAALEDVAGGAGVAGAGAGGAGADAAGVLAQLAHLQRAAVDRDRTHARQIGKRAGADAAGVLAQLAHLQRAAVDRDRTHARQIGKRAGADAAGVLAQLAHLQRAAVDRDRTHARQIGKRAGADAAGVLAQLAHLQRAAVDRDRTHARQIGKRAGAGAAGVLAQLAHLQRAAVDRDRTHARQIGKRAGAGAAGVLAQLAHLQRAAVDRDRTHARQIGKRAGAGAAGVLAQLAHLQRAAVDRDRTHARQIGKRAGAGAAGVLAQLAHLQRAAVDRDRTHARQIAELERAVVKAVEREKVSLADALTLREALCTAQALLQDLEERLQTLTQHAAQWEQACSASRELLDRKTAELESTKSEFEAQLATLKQKLDDAEQRLAAESAALDVERKRNAILQEQLTSRAEVSPPHSVVSDSLSNSLWQSEESGWSGGGGYTGTAALQVEEALALARRRDGELQALVAADSRARRERAVLQATLATTQAKLDDCQSVQEQYDALLQMYGEKEEQVAELKLDLQDVTQLYKAQLDELVALKQRADR